MPSFALTGKETGKQSCLSYSILIPKYAQDHNALVRRVQSLLMEVQACLLPLNLAVTFFPTGETRSRQRCGVLSLATASESSDRPSPISQKNTAIQIIKNTNTQRRLTITSNLDRIIISLLGEKQLAVSGKIFLASL